jgi:MFS family permease
MIIPVAKAYVGDLAPKGKEGTWMGYFNTAFFAGFGFGPLMGGFFTEQFGITYAFVAMGGLSLLSFFSVALFLPEMQIDKSGDRSRPSFRMMSNSQTFRGIFLLQLFEGLGRTGFFAFIPIFAGLTLGVNTSQIGIMLTVHVLLAALLQAPFGKITDKLDRRKVIIGGGAIGAATMALTPLAQNLWHLVAISALAGIAAALVTPAASALSVAEGRRFGMASVMSMTSLAISIGMALGPFLSGFMAEFAGVTAVFYFAAASSLIALTLFGWFTRMGLEVSTSTP